MRGLIAFIAVLLFAGSAAAAPRTLVIFAGQSNDRSTGTDRLWFTQTPGAAGDAGVNATANCYETTDALPGASPGSGTLTCGAPTSGVLYAGQAITAGGAPGQAITAANNGGRFPSATGLGGAGTYVVNRPMAIGSPAAPVTMTFAEPDIGGSGNLNAHCKIWVTSAKGGSWQTYHPRVNSDRSFGVFGPEGQFCQMWSADNPGQTLYMVKVAVAGAALCDLPPNNNDFSPEYTGVVTPTAAYALLLQQTQLAEQALTNQFGAGSYRLSMIEWAQGEQDSTINCAFPAKPFAPSVTPNMYLENLQDLIARMAAPTAVDAQFVGAIAGAQLTVSSVTAGVLREHQALAGAGVLPNTYVGAQISGAPGGVGVYAVQVYQATSKIVISSPTASCNAGFLLGGYFNAILNGGKSCVKSGGFAVGQTLSGRGVLPGTVITALDSEGDTGAGLYRVTVDQTVAAEPMSSSLPGWGSGADTARFVTYRTDYAGPATGVQTAYVTLNDQQGAALNVTVVNVNDALKLPASPIHFHGSWVAELGRRLYLGYLGQCDYNTPTC